MTIAGPVSRHEIIVGNIGTVYDGPDAVDARRTYDTYVTQSKLLHGRAGGEMVTWMRDGEPYLEFVPDYAVLVSIQVLLHVSDVEGERVTTDRKTLGDSIAEAVRNALAAHQADGFQHPLADQLSVIVKEIKVLDTQDTI